MEVIDRRISFNAGEISPWLDPRIDLEKYHAGCRQLENLRASIYGGAIRRAGTGYKGAALTAGTAVRLIPFLGGNGTDYVLEFSHLKMRVWDAATTLLVAGVEIDTVYESTDLNAIQYAQQNDVMYLTHPDYAPQVLLRQAADDWLCGPAKFDWPVTLGPNTTRISVLPWANAYVDTWDSGAAYVVGNHVLSGGIVYRNKLASTNHLPPNATYWDVTTWSNGKVYVVDTVILYSGQYYVAKSAHTAATGSEPGTTAGETYYAKANRIDGIGQGSPSAYNSGTVYPAGTLVTYNSAYYVRTSWLIGLNNIAPTGSQFSLNAWEQVNVTPTGITTSIPKGESITLEASENLFAAGHVGSTWVIAHRRPEAREFLLVDNSASPVGTTSQPLYVLGSWTASTSISLAANTNVVIHIQRSTDLVNWEFYAVITSLPYANNQILTGTEDEPAFLRLKVSSKSGTFPIPGGLLTVDLVADNGTQYGLAQITAVASATVATATVVTPIYSYDRTTRWEEPAFTSVRGFPRAVAFHNGRLWFGGITARPTSVWGSTVDAYWDFRTGSDDDRSLAYTVASDESSTIEWMVSQDMLCVGTTSGEWTLGQRPGDDEIRLRRNTSFGSAPIQGRAIGDALVYVQKSRRKLREFAFNFERDGYLSNDLNQLAEHLGDAEMRQIALQRNPESVVWVVTDRGDLLLLTYERTQNVAGWCRFTTNGTFESVAIVPGDQEEDHVWVCAVRTINGATARYIERIEPDMIRALKAGEANELVFSDSALVVSASAGSDVIVTGELFSAGVAVSFPTMAETADVFPFPALTNAGGYAADSATYKLYQYTGAANAAFVFYGNVGYTADATGIGGNLISVIHVVGVSGIAVTVTGNAITVTAALGSTGAAVIAAVNAHAPAAALVTASAGIGSTASAIAYGTAYYLAGGIDANNWVLAAGDVGATWYADSTEANPWDILPADWMPQGVATGTPTIFPASTTVDGLDHLEGEEVVILADGSSHPAQTVTGGEITLDYPASTAVVGLAYDAVIETTYMESRQVAEFSKVGKKRIHSLTAEFWKTAGVEISADGGTTWTPMETRTPLDLMDSNRSLFSGLREEKLDGRTDRQASIIMRATDPLPMAVLSMNIRYELNTTT